MKCHAVKKNLYRLNDGTLTPQMVREMEAHCLVCQSCHEENERAGRLQKLLTIAVPPSLEPSLGFEDRFWAQIEERQQESWLLKLGQRLDAFMPAFSIPRMALVLSLALMVGSMGGIVSARDSVLSQSFRADQTSVRYLSGFQEFKGIPSASVAAVYLKVNEKAGSLL